MKSGIYKIEHTSGRIYIGSSINVAHRLLVHRWNLGKGSHVNPALQNAWNKYGEQEFLFEKILTCSPEHLILYEQIIIDGYRSHTKPYGYNARIKAESNLGMRKGSKKYTIGAKFGRLTILGRTQDKSRYLFLCDCGKQHVALISSVGLGLTQSCGCLHNDLNSERYTKVKSGDKHNRLTLISLHEKRPGKANLWICRCDCGTEKPFHVNAVAQGRIKSCGCIHKEVAAKLRGIFVLVNNKSVSCAEAERLIGIHKGAIHAYLKRNKCTHQDAVNYYINKLSLD